MTPGASKTKPHCVPGAKSRVKVKCITSHFLSHYKSSGVGSSFVRHDARVTTPIPSKEQWLL